MKDKKAAVAGMLMFFIVILVLSVLAIYVLATNMYNKSVSNERVSNLEARLDRSSKEILLLNYLNSDFISDSEEINVGEYIGSANFDHLADLDNEDRPIVYSDFLTFTKSYFEDSLGSDKSSWYLSLTPILGSRLQDRYIKYGEELYVDSDSSILLITPTGEIEGTVEYIYASQIVPTPDKKNYVLKIVKTVLENE